MPAFVKAHGIQYPVAVDSGTTTTAFAVDSYPDYYLVESVRLPGHLADRDYLQPFYGHPEWGVRGVFNGYLGWFDGNATNLFRLSPESEAERMVELAGGADDLLKAAKDALAAEDGQWAALLADHLLALDGGDTEAKLVKAAALTSLARGTVTATARNYYLTVAHELRAGTKPK